MSRVIGWTKAAEMSILLSEISLESLQGKLQEIRTFKNEFLVTNKGDGHKLIKKLNEIYEDLGRVIYEVSENIVFGDNNQPRESAIPDENS